MRALVAALFTCLAAASAALAADSGKEQIHLNATDQAAARRTVAQRTDLGAAGWTGGAIKADLSATPTCANFHPKQSDLVLTGAASSRWDYQGLEIATEAQVLQTPQMVTADWQRTVLAPNAVPCMQTHLVKQLGAGVTFVHFRRILFPPVATNSRAYLLLVDVKAKTGKVRVAVEVILVGRGRTELTITSIAPNAAQKVVGQADVQLAETLVSRAA